MSRRIAAAALGASLACAVLVAGGPAAAAEGGGASSANRHQRVIDYWTQQRRDRAVPREVSPMAKPGGGGGGSGGTVTGARWTGGGDVVLSTGKVFMTLGGIDYVCSGSAVDSGTVSLVLTAGHCVKDGSGSFVTNFVFYPAYDSGPNPALGAWSASSVFTTTAWGGAGNFDDDAGFAAMRVRADGTTLEQAIRNSGTGGHFVPPVNFSGVTPASYYSFGYPAAKKYNGQTLTYCAGPVTSEIDGDPGTISIACGMTGGSSGGPWIQSFPGTGASISSVNSYGYSYGPWSAYMFGPIFGAGEQAAYTGANGGTCGGSGSTYLCTVEA